MPSQISGSLWLEQKSHKMLGLMDFMFPVDNKA